MERHKITIAAIQETRLNYTSRPLNRLNYAILRSDRGTNSGGGLAFKIHDSIMFKFIVIPSVPQQDSQIVIQII